MAASSLNFERCYRAVESRDARFDGWFITAVLTTGIYCRPSCPTPVHPKRQNVRFYPTAAAAQQAGFRACKRCRPDASPGSPEWNVRGDLVGRAMRLIADGVIDRDGVSGLARRLAVSERHLHRVMAAELGAGPLAIARAQRAQTARTLIETTALPFTEVAFAAGFASTRQFNDTISEVFALTPTALRTSAERKGERANGSLMLRLPFRPPLDWTQLLAWLGRRAISGVAEVDGAVYRRTMRLAGGAAIVELEPARRTSVARCKWSRSPILPARCCAAGGCSTSTPIRRAWQTCFRSTSGCARSCVETAGLRAPGTVEGSELAIQAVSASRSRSPPRGR